MYIYKITNTINNKVYIGLTTTSIEQRWQEHIRDSKKKKNNNSRFYNAIRKYGSSNFKIEIIDTANTLEELNEKEKFWIKTFNSTNKNEGYNICEGGNAYGGLKGIKNGMFGKHHSKETREKISKATKGKKYSPETILKMTIANRKRRQFEKDNNIIHHNSEKCKQLLREKAIKRNSDPNFKLKTVIIHQESIDNTPTLICPHCGFQSKSKGMMQRWHFDNCKPKKTKIINEKFRKTSLEALEKMPIHKCIYCGFESKLKHMIDKFHNENCKLKDPIFRKKYLKLGKKKYSSFFINKFYKLYKKGLF